jgi:hypothetical protein
MTAIPSYFNDFLEAIRLTSALRGACQEKHQFLRRLLKEDAKLSQIIVDVFLQGSYARDTGTRPIDPASVSEHVDVDLVLVTTLDHEANSPDHVVTMLTPFLDRVFPDHWSPNDRSIKITFDDTTVTLDLVITAAPSMVDKDVVFKSLERGAGGAGRLLTLSERRLDEPPNILMLHEAVTRVVKAAGLDGDWRENPLLIPDRLVKSWVETHPIRQSEWTTGKNSRTNGHYVNVVKAIKWWRRRNATPEYPKGYPLEHLVGFVCPDGVESVAEGLTLSLETIVRDFRAHTAAGLKPALPDHGVPDNDVFRRVSSKDFAGFYALVEAAAGQARQALDSPTPPESATVWHLDWPLWQSALRLRFHPSSGSLDVRSKKSRAPNLSRTGSRTTDTDGAWRLT